MPSQYDASRWAVGKDGSRTRVVLNAADYGINATDSALETAAAHGVDISDVQGTGAKGRVTKQDVEDHLEDDE